MSTFFKSFFKGLYQVIFRPTWTDLVIGTIVIAIMMYLVGGPARGATIEVVPLSGKPFASVITVTGGFGEGDDRAFRAKLASAPQPAIVSFNSPGGLLSVGLDIGERIKERGMPTVVPDLMTCASACAFAWLSGSPRYLGKTGRVGFHGVYEVNREVSRSGNAVLGAYLGRLGMSSSAIIYMTSAPPEQLEWLTKAQAARYSIAFIQDNPAMVSAAKWPDPPSAKPPELSPLHYYLGTGVLAVVNAFQSQQQAIHERDYGPRQ